MTHPEHLKEFLQLGKKMQFLVSSSFDFLLLLSLIQPLSFLHAFLPAATLETFPPSSSTAVDKSRCCCWLLFQGLLALLKDLSTLNPMNFTENFIIPWPPSLEWQHLNNGHFNSAASSLHILIKTCDNANLGDSRIWPKNKIYLQNIRLKPNLSNLDSQYFFVGTTTIQAFP